MSLCSGENADSLSVFTQGEANSAAWDALAPIESRDDGPTEFTLFEAPPAWDVDEEGDLEPLVDGVLYGLSATTTGYDAAGGMTRPRRSGVDFSLDQLRQLGDGEVLVTTESFEGAVKSLEEFESDAEATC
jgi:hypothetical protein